MKQFKTVFGFELKNMLRSKTIIISTAILSIIILLATTIPTFMLWFSPGGDSGDEVNSGFEVLYDNESLEEALSGEFGKSDYTDINSLRAAIQKGEIEAGFVIHDFYDYTYITYDSSSSSMEQFNFEDKLRQLSQQRLFRQEGIDDAKVYEILNRPLKAESVTLGKDAASGLIIGYAFILVLYMLIVIYGTSVATSVAREKDSRTMELLITSTKPRTLILGKVAATGLMGILQVASIVLATLVGVFVNKANYPPIVFELIKDSMTLDTMMVYLLFSVLGYVLYLFIYASLGSLVTKVEDVNSAVAPITMLFVIAYLVASFAMQFPDNGIIKVTSFIPFLSIFTMPIRYGLTSVSLISLLSSSLIMILTLVLFAELSIYIYRFGSLNYGNRVKIRDIFKSFK
ncbi:MAG: ABC transporter permease [Tissierellia bacterium]|nr:ABC transporter permease [Tissierellia bacterium]